MTPPQSDKELLDNWQKLVDANQIAQPKGTAQTAEELRSEFEEWAREVMLCDPEHLERLTAGKGPYRVHNVQCWWDAWKACDGRRIRSASPERITDLATKYCNKAKEVRNGDCPVMVDISWLHGCFQEMGQELAYAASRKQAPKLEELIVLARVAWKEQKKHIGELDDAWITDFAATFAINQWRDGREQAASTPLYREAFELIGMLRSCLACNEKTTKADDNRIAECLNQLRGVSVGPPPAQQACPTCHSNTPKRKNLAKCVCQPEKPGEPSPHQAACYCTDPWHEGAQPSEAMSLKCPTCKSDDQNYRRPYVLAGQYSCSDAWHDGALGESVSSTAASDWTACSADIGKVSPIRMEDFNVPSVRQSGQTVRTDSPNEESGMVPAGVDRTGNCICEYGYASTCPIHGNPNAIAETAAPEEKK